MEKTFTTKRDFLDAAGDSLLKTESNLDVREAVLRGVSQADDLLTQWRGQENAGLELRLGRWFIRNDDFPFFQLLGAVASGLLALGASGGVAAAALVGPISNFASACWQVHRKGANLSPEQVATLGVLNTNQGATVKEIAEKLAATGRVSTENEVRATLKSLTSIELYDGSLIAIIRSDDEQKWRALSV